MAISDLTLSQFGGIAVIVALFAGGITLALYALNDWVFELYEDPSVGFGDIAVFLTFAFCTVGVLLFSTALICESDIGKGCKAEKDAAALTDSPISVSCKSLKFAYAAFFSLIASVLLVFMPQFFGYRSARLAGTDPNEQTFAEFAFESIVLIGTYWMVFMTGIIAVCVLEPVAKAQKLIVAS